MRPVNEGEFWDGEDDSPPSLLTHSEAINCEEGRTAGKNVLH